MQTTPLYAIFWSLNGVTGNGKYILTKAELERHLGLLRLEYPNMNHWGELPGGERYNECVSSSAYLTATATTTAKSM